MTAHTIGTDREHDEIILQMLELRQRKYTSAAIGRAFGDLRPEYVRTLTNRIRDKDIAFSKGVERAKAKRFWGVA